METPTQTSGIRSCITCRKNVDENGGPVTNPMWVPKCYSTSVAGSFINCGPGLEGWEPRDEVPAPQIKARKGLQFVAAAPLGEAVTAMIEFQGRIYVGTTGGLYVLEGEDLKPVGYMDQKEEK